MHTDVLTGLGTSMALLWISRIGLGLMAGIAVLRLALPSEKQKRLDRFLQKHHL